MASDDSLPTIKILLIGPSGAGKSACESYISVSILFRGTLIVFSLSNLVVFGLQASLRHFHTREGSCNTRWHAGMHCCLGGFLTTIRIPEVISFVNTG